MRLVLFPLKIGMGAIAVIAVLSGLAAGAGYLFPSWWDTPLAMDTRIDRVVVEKSENRLELIRGTEVLKSYRVAFGFNPIGHKQRQGDGRTPEGKYVLDSHNSNSKFHLSLHVSYPNKRDRASAAARGVSPGGAIMVHGFLNELWFARYFAPLDQLHTLWDLTAGCIAMTDSQIEEVFRVVHDGTPIEINP